MHSGNDRLDRLRAGQTEIGNHVIDEFVAGRLNRRDFLRSGALVGISAPVLGGILAACGSSSPSPSTTSSGAAASGATIKVGIVTPASAINPVTIADQGGLDMLGQTGEYLCLSDQTLTLQPVLATSWTSNSTADVWTFKIRQGVKFHNGSPLTADDVVYTYKLQTNPAGKGSALSAIRWRADAGRRGEGRRLHGRVPPERAERQLPVPDVVRQLHHDHPAEGLRPGQWQSYVHRHRTVQAEELHREGGRRPSSVTRITGAPKAIPAATEFTFYDNRDTRRSWR